MKNEIQLAKEFFLSLQQRICDLFEQEDGLAKFQKDSWQRQEGGGGLSCVLENGAVIERGGVNFSHVFGEKLPPSATALRPALAGGKFEATGISLVMHPRNPYAPTTHMNLRLFVATKDDYCEWWFGGGFDLTPYYGFVDDCVHWHKTAKAACTPFGDNVYHEFKKWCDEYFYLTHRQEPRGIGGIFFDDLNRWNFETCFEFVKNVGEHFILAYFPILKLRKNMPFGEREKEFQLYRRGRYVEFNLVYDRGTLFGLQTKGRTESILMSMPPQANWRYNWHPDVETEEAKFYKEFLTIKDWI